MKKIKFDEKLAINTLRVLSASAITKAKSGHPGIALGAAPIFYDLFVNQMNISPTYHEYYNRDRFVLSAGHASSLLYATMLLCGYNNITMEDFKNFRQLNSKCAGHPEPHLLNNVEVCSGPLGQGISMAVGMAIASKKAADLVNSPSARLINNYVYCLFGDGCFEEGISYESFAIAARLHLNNLIMIYDYNNVQLDGRVSDSTEIDTLKYFKSIGWNVIYVGDVEDLEEFRKAIRKAKSPLNNKPTCIVCKTILGFGSVNADTNKAHGTPLTPEQLLELKKTLKFDYPEFTIPEELNSIKEYVNQRVEEKVLAFNCMLNDLEKSNTELYKNAINLIVKKQFVFDPKWYDVSKFPAADSTRKIAGEALQPITLNNPNLIVSIADLSCSTMIKAKESSKITAKNWEGQNLDCGVREFAMGAINNGITAFGGFKAIGSTFMSFSDYNKAAIRLAAISKIPSINIYSHDSITVGEDGPTHQPIEQLWTLRSIPNHVVFRPTSYIDTVIAYEYAINSKETPVSIITSRANFKQVNVDYETAKRGGYVVFKPQTQHQLTIYATGSEVPVAIDVANQLSIPTRVVAINSLEVLNAQDKQYLDTIFDSSKKVSIEYGSTIGWYKYVDLAIGTDRFGVSAKPDDVLKTLGLTVSQITETINNWYNKQ